MTALREAVPGVRRTFEAYLPIGYTDASGQVHRRAVLRKMRGHEEALLYDTSLSPSRLVTELLRSCVLRLGDIEAPDDAVLTQLYTADRNYLLLELRRITLGDRLEAVYACPSCGRYIHRVEDLREIEVRHKADDEPLEDIVLELEDGYVDRDGQAHTEVVLTLPKGTDEEFVEPMFAKDPLKAQDALLLRCIKRFGTMPKAALEAYGVKILRDLTMGDRLAIDRALNGNTPGVNLERRIDCPDCGRSFYALLDVSRFLDLG